jgi:ATP-dependent Clp protease ATP-binding subunit ClpA
MPFILQSCVDRQFPDKVIDIIDEACVTTRIDVMNNTTSTMVGEFRSRSSYLIQWWKK